MKDVMTTRDAAKILDIAPESIARLLRQGKLDGERFGNVWMVYRTSVDAYLERTAGKSKNDPTRGKDQ